MKISVNDIELFTLSETQKKVIMNDINSDEFDADMCRRLQYILMHKYERCLDRLKSEWLPKLKDLGVSSIPTDDIELADLIFLQSSYKDKKARDAEENLSLGL